MRRRDFLAGLAAAVGLASFPVVASFPWADWGEHTKPKETFDFSWHVTSTSRKDFEAVARNLIVNERGQLEARLA